MNAVTVPTLQALVLTQTEKSQPQIYQPKDVIRFNVEIPETLFDKQSL
jgi:hypothetical protein